jgi:hypothetical protein
MVNDISGVDSWKDMGQTLSRQWVTAGKTALSHLPKVEYERSFIGNERIVSYPAVRNH